MALEPHVGTSIVNKTGLTGGFDIELLWKPGGLGGGDIPLGERTSIFDAIQEQLGLRLESRQAKADVLVIDRIERPTED